MSAGACMASTMPHIEGTYPPQNLVSVPDRILPSVTVAHQGHGMVRSCRKQPHVPIPWRKTHIILDIAAESAMPIPSSVLLRCLRVEPRNPAKTATALSSTTSVVLCALRVLCGKISRSSVLLRFLHFLRVESRSPCRLRQPLYPCML